MMTVNRKFTFVPTSSGCCVRMKAPEREMLLTYSVMNSSTEANSWLIVIRSSRGTSFLVGFAIFPDLFVFGVLPVGAALLPLLGRLAPEDLVLLHMVARARLDEHPLLQPLLDVVDVLVIRGHEQIRDLRMALDDDRVLLDRVAAAPELAQDLVANRGLGLEIALALAVEAGLGQLARDALAGPLARHLDQPEFADLGHVGARPVGFERLVEGLPHLL